MLVLEIGLVTVQCTILQVITTEAAEEPTEKLLLAGGDKTEAAHPAEKHVIDCPNIGPIDVFVQVRLSFTVQHVLIVIVFRVLVLTDFSSVS